MLSANFARRSTVRASTGRRYAFSANRFKTSPAYSRRAFASVGGSLVKKRSKFFGRVQNSFSIGPSTFNDARRNSSEFFFFSLSTSGLFLKTSGFSPSAHFRSTSKFARL